MKLKDVPVGTECRMVEPMGEEVRVTRYLRLWRRPDAVSQERPSR